MDIEHIVPTHLGGKTVEDNLWLACSLCNKYKSARVEAPDPATGGIVSLFNPRRQRWADHIRWLDRGARVEGITPTGRATVAALRLNRALLVAA